MPDTSLRLLRPARLGALTLSNRAVMAPMTRNRAGRDGTPTPMMVEYYRQRASAGLIVTEATQVSRDGQGYPFTPGLHEPGHAEAWARVVDAVHEAGGRIFAQLFHGGRIGHEAIGGVRPVAPSAVAAEGTLVTYEGVKNLPEPRALAAGEIEAIVGAFATAAAMAREAGFDGVELHAANGYLLDQFLRDGTNRRTDGWGGTPERRARFAIEVARAVSAEVGAERTGVRVSPASTFNSMSDSDPDRTFTALARGLSGIGVAYLHVVENGGPEALARAFGWDELRRGFEGTCVVCGDYDRERAEDALQAGRADLVAFGRPFLANPDLVRRFAERAPLNDPDRETFYGGDRKGYLDYPTLDGVREARAGV